MNPPHVLSFLSFTVCRSKNFVLTACCQRVRMNIHHHSFCVNRFFIFFQKFFDFFFDFFSGGFPRFQAHSLRGGRLLSVTGGRGGFPRPADAGRGARRRRAHGCRMMTRGIGAARSVPRRPCRGWRTCPQQERTAMRSTGIPAPRAVPGMGGAAWSRMAEPRKARSTRGRAIYEKSRTTYGTACLGAISLAVSFYNVVGMACSSQPRLRRFQF